MEAGSTLIMLRSDCDPAARLRCLEVASKVQNAGVYIIFLSISRLKTISCPQPSTRLLQLCYGLFAAPIDSTQSDITPGRLLYLLHKTPRIMRRLVNIELYFGS